MTTEQIITKAQARWPKFRIVDKRDSRLMRVIGWLLTPINKEFMSHYVTVIGWTVYAPDGYIDADTLAHECQHMADRERWGILFDLSYLFLLPAGLTMRSYWELRAYRVTLEWSHVYAWSTRETLSNTYIGWVAQQFTSSAYLWMALWPWLVRRILWRMVRKIEAGERSALWTWLHEGEE